MAHLKIYEWEFQTYGEFRFVPLDRDTEGRKIIRKLSRHFNLMEPTLAQSRRRGGAGKYRPRMFGEGIIFTGKKTNLMTLCHEFAHHLEYHSDGHSPGRWHGKNFKRQLKRVYTWARRYIPKSL